jgi:hypothetical protein
MGQVFRSHISSIPSADFLGLYNPSTDCCVMSPKVGSDGGHGNEAPAILIFDRGYDKFVQRPKGQKND